MGSTTTAAGAEVWIDEGHGRLGVVDVIPFGIAIASVSANDGRVLGGFIDDMYKPTKGELTLPSFLDLEPGQRVFFRTETMRLSTADPALSIRDLTDDDVTRHFVTITVLPDGVDDPPATPKPKTRPIANADIPPPPPPRAAARPKRYAPSHRNQWDYNAVFGAVMCAYNGIGGYDPAAIHDTASSVLLAADLVQEHLEHHVDRTSYAHARMRGAVFSIVGHHPAPAIADVAAKRGWLVGVALTAAALVRITDDIGGWS